MTDILFYQRRIAELKLESIIILRKEILNDLKGLALNFPGPEKKEDLGDWEPTTQEEFKSIVEMEAILIEAEELLIQICKLTKRYSAAIGEI